MPMAYHFILAGITVVVGATLALQSGKKWGWLVLGAGLYWIYYTFKSFGVLQ
jgi:hypothetical protein